MQYSDTKVIKFDKMKVIIENEKMKAILSSTKW